jgi:hypothetical protein
VDVLIDLDPRVPSRSLKPYLRDSILHDLVNAFYESGTASDAVTRALEIIPEATRRLPQDLKERHPEIDWIAIAAAGNVYPARI